MPGEEAGSEAYSYQCLRQSEWSRGGCGQVDIKEPRVLDVWVEARKQRGRPVDPNGWAAAGWGLGAHSGTVGVSRWGFSRCINSPRFEPRHRKWATLHALDRKWPGVFGDQPAVL